MPLYRKKPVVIEAFKLTRELDLSVPKWFVEMIASGDASIDRNPPEEPVISLNTLEGVMHARIGDYIIKSIKGEVYPCKPDIFEQTYEQVGSADD